MTSEQMSRTTKDALLKEIEQLEQRNAELRREVSRERAEGVRARNEVAALRNRMNRLRRTG
jgi:cell division septum initiation protein DivIVA